MQTGAATIENSMEVPQKTKSRNTIQSRNCTPGYLPKKKKPKPLIWIDICTPMFTAVLYTIAKI